MITAINNLTKTSFIDAAIGIHDSAVESYAAGDLKKAESLFLRSLRLFEQHDAPDSPDIAAVLNNLAAVYEDRCEYKRAERLFERSVRVLEKITTDDRDVQNLFIESLC
ncbi:MAG TPA: tetratricopeptide repeat protein, partial [Blastocatellia bacterium]|nr:tetratricopeptide repeat protein [Blastocatellia bacterium]